MGACPETACAFAKAASAAGRLPADKWCLPGSRQEAESRADKQGDAGKHGTCAKQRPKLAAIWSAGRSQWDVIPVQHATSQLASCFCKSTLQLFSGHSPVANHQGQMRQHLASHFCV